MNHLLIMMNLRTILIYLLFHGLVSCQPFHHTQSSPAPAVDSGSRSENIQRVENTQQISDLLDTSVYDNLKFADRVNQQRQQLIRLDSTGLFEKLHLKLSTNLTERQSNYFRIHSNLRLLALTQGDLFRNGLADAAYVVYNKARQQVEIILFDQGEGNFNTLYRDVKVANTIRDLDCFYSFGTLDYLIASELIYQEDYIRMSQSNYLIDDHAFAVDNIATNQNFDLQRGCLNKQVPKAAMANTLCIPTNSVYANYQCLKYNKKKQIFEIYFGQEFAD